LERKDMSQEPTHHEVIRSEINSAQNALDQINKSIEELCAQRDRLYYFCNAMQEALIRIPEQLELELVDSDSTSSD